MRKLRRMALRNEANRLSNYGQNGKSIAIFRSLWADYKELQQHKEVAKKAGCWRRLRALRGNGQRSASNLKKKSRAASPFYHLIKVLTIRQGRPERGYIDAIRREDNKGG